MKVVPVSGTVMYKGQPLEGASVSFWGDGSGRPALGLTDAAGKFKLSTYDPGDGAAPGDHKVTVSKSIMSGDDSWKKQETMEEAAARGDNIPQPPKELHVIPKKYSEAATTDLKVTVPEGGAKDVVIEIKE
jgi:hypothetical protein